jgi:hypothetical protein
MWRFTANKSNVKLSGDQLFNVEWKADVSVTFYLYRHGTDIPVSGNIELLFFMEVADPTLVSSALFLHSKWRQNLV